MTSRPRPRPRPALVTLSLRIPPDLRDRAESAAKGREQYLSEWIREAIELALEQERAEK